MSWFFLTQNINPHKQTIIKNTTITAVAINLDTAKNFPSGKAGVLKSSGYFNIVPHLLYWQFMPDTP